MELVPAGVELSFEVTFDADDLDVAMSVYDDSGEEPVLLLSPFAMDLVAAGLNTYRGKFTPEAGKNYIIVKGVYTDDTFETFDTNYSQGSESVYAQYLNPPFRIQPVSVSAAVRRIRTFISRRASTYRVLPTPMPSVRPYPLNRVR